MHNYWLKQIHIKEAVALLTILLNDEFKGDIPNPMKWLSLIADFIDTLYFGDMIIIAGLTKYEIICEVDDYGLVENISLISKI
jgi:hypothetical protein